MQISHDVTIGVRRVEDAPTSHPWQWVGTIIIGAIVCFAVVAFVARLVDGWAT
jgi:hypothetical protein